MELKIEQVAVPEKIAFNYEELKKELSDKVKVYETLVYTDDQIKNAKADRADLNRLKKALNDERIRREKEYMQPFNVFKAQIDEIIGIIDKPVALIDKQIKEYEEQQKAEKKKKIEEFFSAYPHPEWLKLSQIWEDRWLNASVSLKRAQEEIDGHVDNIEQDIATLSELPEFAFEAIETYKTTLDLNKSIAEGHRLSEIQKRKAEQERIKAEQEKASAEQERLRKEQEEEQARLAAMVTPEEIAESAEVYREAAGSNGVHIFDPTLHEPHTEEDKPFGEWVSFKACLTVDDAKALSDFFKSRNIEFSRI